MKAAVFNRYGGNEVVQIREMPKPVCGVQDVLIRVRAAGVNPVDWKVRSGQAKFFTGKRFPKILGNECSGEIVETGSSATRFKPGDQVIGWPSVWRLGAFAEFASVPQSSTFPKVSAVTFEQAACIPIAGLTALQALRDKGRVSSGKKVLINGAAGGVGHFAVQIAKIFGAPVTGVCSGPNIEFVKSLGADRVIDHGRDDFAGAGEQYDIIFDAVSKRSFRECKRALAPGGIYITTLPSAAVILNQFLFGRFSRRKAAVMSVRQNEADLQWMMDHVSAGRIRIVIDRSYSLPEAAEALAYSEGGKARGKHVLTISS